MKKTTVAIVLKSWSNQTITMTWLGCNNLGDKHLLKLFVIQKFRSVSHFWTYDELGRGWSMTGVK